MRLQWGGACLDCTSRRRGVVVKVSARMLKKNICNACREEMKVLVCSELAPISHQQNEFAPLPKFALLLIMLTRLINLCLCLGVPRAYATVGKSTYAMSHPFAYKV
jgi:hypothetical protein